MEAEEEKDGVFWWMEKQDWMLLECNGVLRSCNLFFVSVEVLVFFCE